MTTAQPADLATIAAEAAAQVMARPVMRPGLDTEPGPDPRGVFDRLIAEVEAAQVVMTFATGPDEQRRAALDGLALARDVIADAAEALDTPPTPAPGPERTTR